MKALTPTEFKKVETDVKSFGLKLNSSNWHSKSKLTVSKKSTGAKVYDDGVMIQFTPG